MSCPEATRVFARIKINVHWAQHSLTAPPWHRHSESLACSNLPWHLGGQSWQWGGRASGLTQLPVGRRQVQVLEAGCRQGGRSGVAQC